MTNLFTQAPGYGTVFAQRHYPTQIHKQCQPLLGSRKASSNNPVSTLDFAVVCAYSVFQAGPKAIPDFHAVPMKQRSVLFIFVLWCTIVALVGDGINLDDLFAGQFVVHDYDDLAITQEYLLSVGWTLVPSPALSLSEGLARIQPVAASECRSKLRVVYDEDAPQLDSDPFDVGLPLFDCIVQADRSANVEPTTSQPLSLLLSQLLLI